MPETQIVTAAIIVDTDGRILIAQRPEGKFMSGWWEFPGGKLEFAEPPELGLAREVREELGIEIQVLEPFHVVNICRTPDTAVIRLQIASTTSIRLPSLKFGTHSTIRGIKKPPRVT